MTDAESWIVRIRKQSLKRKRSELLTRSRQEDDEEGKTSNGGREKGVINFDF